MNTSHQTSDNTTNTSKNKRIKFRSTGTKVSKFYNQDGEEVDIEKVSIIDKLYPDAMIYMGVYLELSETKFFGRDQCLNSGVFNTGFIFQFSGEFRWISIGNKIIGRFRKMDSYPNHFKIPSPEKLTKRKLLQCVKNGIYLKGFQADYYIKDFMTTNDEIDNLVSNLFPESKKAILKFLHIPM